MQPDKIKHIKIVKARGKRYAYFDTGKRTDTGQPIRVRCPLPDQPGFWDSYSALMGARTKRDRIGRTISELIRRYETSEQYTGKSAGTQKAYGVYLRKIDRLLGAFPITDLTPDDVDDAIEIEDFGPGAHNLFLSVLAVLYAFARKKRWTDLDPTKDMDRRDTGEWEAWPAAMVKAGLETSDPRARLAIHLLLYTGQRIGDVCKMRWSDIVDGHISVTQQKTGKRLDIRIHSDLAAELERHGKKGITLLTGMNGRPIAAQTLRGQIKAICAAEGHAGLLPHGLRKNAVIALLEAGCTVSETAAITGQTFQIVEYYARQIDQRKQGNAAILKWEQSGDRENGRKHSEKSA